MVKRILKRSTTGIRIFFIISANERKTAVNSKKLFFERVKNKNEIAFSVNSYARNVRAAHKILAKKKF